MKQTLSTSQTDDQPVTRFLDTILESEDNLEVEFQERPNGNLVIYLHVAGTTIARVFGHEDQIIIKDRRLECE